MNRSEESPYRRHITPPDVAELKSQLARLRQDHDRFSGKVTAAVLQTALQAKIAQVEAEIAALEQHRAATQPASASADRSDSGRSHHARMGPFRPRFRPGR